MRSLSFAVVALFALGASACSQSTGATPDAPRSSPPDGLTLTADADTYARGGAAHVTLRNGTDATYGMGVLECAVLERPADDGWEQAPEGNDRACILIYRSLAPGETMEADIPLDVSPGTYRITHSVSNEATEASESISTEPFEVTG